MKVHILSDLHLEFSEQHPPFVPPQTDAKVVVLAGDIDNGTRAIDWAEQTFPDKTVLYVPGNHEYYGAEIPDASHALRARAGDSPNVHLLDNDELVLDGVRFLGATLWTDFELFGQKYISSAITESLRYVLDFHAIREGEGRFTPDRSIELHGQALEFLEHGLAKPFRGETVVITHHAPHRGSLHPRWEQHLTSAAFVSDLTRLMGRSALWIHGHTHDGFDYSVNGTRVVANPMGYRTSNWLTRESSDVPVWVTYENAGFDPGLTVHIPC